MWGQALGDDLQGQTFAIDPARGDLAVILSGYCGAGGHGDAPVPQGTSRHRLLRPNPEPHVTAPHFAPPATPRRPAPKSAGPSRRGAARAFAKKPTHDSCSTSLARWQAGCLEFSACADAFAAGLVWPEPGSRRFFRGRNQTLSRHSAGPRS